MDNKLVISRREVAELIKMDVLARLHETRQKLSLFEAKYESSFDAFQDGITDRAEDFARWDDYLEWKAYEEVHRDLKQKLSDLEVGNFEIA